MADSHHPEPDHPFSDEELSSILDGEADAALVERVEADERARIRLEELRTASALVRDSAVPRPPGDVIDRMIERAVAEAEPAGASISTLARPSRSSPKGPPRLLVAAVVVVLAAIGLGLIWSGTRVTDGDNTASIAPSSEEDSDGAEREPGAADDPRHMALADMTPVDLGVHPDIPSLRSSLSSGIPQSPSGDLDPVPEDEKPETDEMTRCAVQMWELWRGENLRQLPDATGFATVDGDPVLVYEFGVTEDDHEALISIATPTECDPQGTFFID